MTVVSYAFEEALASLRRSGRSALVSVGTIAIAFITLGGFLLASVNIQDVLDRWLEAAEISVYLHDTATTADRVALEQLLRGRPEVAAVEYVSKERALERFRADFPELADVTSSLSQNPVPSALEVRLKGGDDASASAETLTKEVSGRTGVADVQFDRTWLARLLDLVNSARGASGQSCACLCTPVAMSLKSWRSSARRSATFVVHSSAKACSSAGSAPLSP